MYHCISQRTEEEMFDACSLITQVLINVYDMLEPSLLTNIGYVLGVGIYHSGVEILGREYCFGGHEYENMTGVFAVEPKIGPPGVMFKQSVSMGYTDLSESEIGQVLQTLSQEFVGTSYNLLTRNCNHFTDELCKRLTGKSAPGWINRAAKLGTMFPCVIPSEWIEPPEYETDPIQSPTSVTSSSQPASPAMSYSSRTPLKSGTTGRYHTGRHHREQGYGSPSQATSRPNSPTSSNSRRPYTGQSSPTSRHSSTSFEFRHYHYQYQNHRRSSVPLSSSRRPSGSILDQDRESIVLVRPSSPLIDDELNADNPVKEPDSSRPEVIRSATQLSISASLQEIERPSSKEPASTSG